MRDVDYLALAEASRSRPSTSLRLAAEYLAEALEHLDAMTREPTPRPVLTLIEGGRGDA